MTKNEVHWYIALTKSCQERKAAEALAALGEEFWFPVRKVRRKWSDRMKTVMVPVLPRMIFVRADDAHRRELTSRVYGICAWMFDSANKAPAIVRDCDFENFRDFVNGVEVPVEVVPGRYAAGDRVEIVRGPLAGRIYELVSVDDRRCLAVHLGSSATALFDFPLGDLKKIEN